MMSKEQDNYSITEEQELALTKYEMESEQKMSTMAPEEREASALLEQEAASKQEDSIEINYEVPVLTLGKQEDFETPGTLRERVWHELQHAYFTQKPLSGDLGGVEETKSGSVVVVYYKQYRVLIPVSEMNLKLIEDESESMLKTRQLRVLASMIGCEIDFIILGLDEEEKTAVGSRSRAMEYKRRRYFFPKENGTALVEKGRIVQARVIAVGDKFVRLEVFGAECNVKARNLSWEWIGDARDLYHVGDIVLAAVTSVDRNEETGQVKISVDMRQLQKNDVMDKLRHCKLKGKYSGRVVDIHKGVVYLRLDIGVNAIAHRNLDYRQPGRGDIVSFVVNRIDTNHGVAVGLLTRIIRQNI